MRNSSLLLPTTWPAVAVLAEMIPSSGGEDGRVRQATLRIGESCLRALDPRVGGRRGSHELFGLAGAQRAARPECPGTIRIAARLGRTGAGLRQQGVGLVQVRLEGAAFQPREYLAFAHRLADIGVDRDDSQAGELHADDDLPPGRDGARGRDLARDVAANRFHDLDRQRRAARAGLVSALAAASQAQQDGGPGQRRGEECPGATGGEIGHV